MSNGDNVLYVLFAVFSVCACTESGRGGLERGAVDTGAEDTGAPEGTAVGPRELLERTGVLGGGGDGTYCAVVGGRPVCTNDAYELLDQMEAEPVSVRYCWLYEHISYGGSAAWIDFDVADLRSLYGSNWEDRISGVMCSLAGAQLWEHRNYNPAGVRKTFYWDSDLRDDGWNDRASSIRFR